MSVYHKVAEAFPVWEFVEKELDARGWNDDDLLDRMSGDRDQNECCLELMYLGDSRVRLGEFAAKLGEAFGTSADLWTNIEKFWLNRLESASN